MERLTLRMTATMVVLCLAISFSIGQNTGFGPQFEISTEEFSEVYVPSASSEDIKPSSFIYQEDIYENPFEINDKSEGQKTYAKVYAWLVEKTRL